MQSAHIRYVYIIYVRAKYVYVYRYSNVCMQCEYTACTDTIICLAVYSMLPSLEHDDTSEHACTLYTI